MFVLLTVAAKHSTMYLFLTRPHLLPDIEEHTIMMPRFRVRLDRVESISQTENY